MKLQICIFFECEGGMKRTLWMKLAKVSKINFKCKLNSDQAETWWNKPGHDGSMKRTLKTKCLNQLSIICTWPLTLGGSLLN